MSWPKVILTLAFAAGLGVGLGMVMGGAYDAGYAAGSGKAYKKEVGLQLDAERRALEGEWVREYRQSVGPAL